MNLHFNQEQAVEKVFSNITNFFLPISQCFPTFLSKRPVLPENLAKSSQIKKKLKRPASKQF